MTLKIIPYGPGAIQPGGPAGPREPQAYSVDSDRIRWVRGKVQPIGGWETPPRTDPDPK